MATEEETAGLPGKHQSLATSQLFPESNDDTLTEVDRPLQHDTVTIGDWSQTGRGSHVEFGYEESVPLKQGA
jgi:hypothetical protein